MQPHSGNDHRAGHARKSDASVSVSPGMSHPEIQQPPVTFWLLNSYGEPESHQRGTKTNEIHFLAFWPSEVLQLVLQQHGDRYRSSPREPSTKNVRDIQHLLHSTAHCCGTAIARQENVRLATMVG